MGDVPAWVQVLLALAFPIGGVLGILSDEYWTRRAERERLDDRDRDRG